MLEWLHSLRIALENGYLFFPSVEAFKLKALLAQIEQTQHPTHSEIYTIIETLSTQTPLDRYLKNTLIELFNKSTRTAHEKHLETDAKEQANIVDIVTHQISLAVSYHRLFKQFVADRHTNHHDEKDQQNKFARSLEQLEKAAQQNLSAYRGLAAMKQQTTRLASGINLCEGILLVWEAIPNLTGEESKDAKKQFMEQLSTLHSDYYDYRQERNPSEIQKILNQFFQIINKKHTHVKVIDRFDQINELLQKRCHQSLQDHICNEHASEQHKILYHLDKKESCREHLTFANYITEKSERIAREFSVYEFAFAAKNLALKNDRDKANIASLIKAEVNVSLEEISAPWLRESIKTHLRNNLDSWSQLKVAEKNSKLLEVFEYEIKCSKDAKRAELLTTLRTGLFTKMTPSWKSDEQEIDAIYERYKNILAIDECHHKLKEIQEKSSLIEIRSATKQLSEKYSYGTLTNAINKMHYFHREIRAKRLYWNQCHPHIKKITEELKTQTEAITKREKELSQHLRVGQDKEKDFFKANFKYPKTYYAFGNSKQETLTKISSIFKDYADKAHWYYFHAFRSHSAEARKIEQKIKETNDINAIKKYLIDINNSLLAKETYNVQGSFSRRLHYCFKLLDEVKIIPAEISHHLDEKHSDKQRPTFR